MPEAEFFPTDFFLGFFGRRKIDQEPTANDKLLPLHRYPVEGTGPKMQEMSGRMNIVPGKGNSEKETGNSAFNNLN